MNPLSSSSSNLERARLDAARAAPANEAAQADTPAAGGFADLLRGAKTQPANTAQAAANKLALQAGTAQGSAAAARSQAPATPPQTDQTAPLQQNSRQLRDSREASALAQRQADARSEAARAAARTDGAADRAEAATEAATAPADEKDEAAPQNTQTAPGDTLAHWLLSQGLHVGGPAAAQAGAAGLPPPQDPAPATDDLSAAAMAREVLEAVRQRAMAGGAAASAGAEARSSAVAHAGATALPVGHEAKPELNPAGPAGAESSSLPGKLGPREQREGSTDFAQALGGAVAAQASIPQGVPDVAGVVAERSIDTPVGHPAFGEAVGVSISRLVSEGVHEARLQLNPAELGPVSVHIAMHGSEARIELGAALADTRALLDASMPALAEALRGDGLVLAASQVSEWRSDSSGSNAPGNSGNSNGSTNSPSAAWAGDGGAAGNGNGQPGAGGSSRGGGERAPAGESWRMAWPSASAVPLPGHGAAPGRNSLGGLDLYA